MHVASWLVISIWFAIPALTAGAQEVLSVDLTKVVARKELRNPPLTSLPVPRIAATEIIHSCPPTTKNAGQLRATLLSIDNTTSGNEPTFDLTVENVSSNPVTIPVSPHLADLQPADPARQFTFMKLAVVLWIGGRNWKSDTGGGVALYGDEVHANTMLSVKPGEWVRIIGRGNLEIPSDPGVERLVRNGDKINHTQAEIALSNDVIAFFPGTTSLGSNQSCVMHSMSNEVAITVK